MPRGYMVTLVHRDSPAHRAALQAGDRLVKINGSYFFDLLDYNYLCAGKYLRLDLIKKDGRPCRRVVHKKYDEPLGLEFARPTIGPLRHCHNRCLFCFIDQQPAGLRPTLYEKDDDYRLSFLQGNYLSLTNTGKGEFARIIRRRLSPLYISVHTTDPALRCRMMGHPAAGAIMDQLALLARAGITMHGQVVVCPGYNDGAALQQTIEDLFIFYPRLKTVALVPAGLTRYRKGLTPLRSSTRQEALDIIRYCSGRQKFFLKKRGTPFVYLADEYYRLTRWPLPPHRHYGSYDQLENGVGLARLFLNDLEVWRKYPPKPFSGEKVISCATGKAAGPLLQLFMRELSRIPGLKGLLHILPNRFWGGNVNVAGLLTGRDLLQELTGKPLGGALFITAAMLKEESDLFLDGITLAELSTALKVPVIPVHSPLEIRHFLQNNVAPIKMGSVK